MDNLQALLAELTSGDDDRAEVAALALTAFGAAAVAALQEMYSSQTGPSAQQVDNRWWAIRTLAEIHDPQVPSFLVRALSDPDASVRQCAALAFHRQPDPQATAALIEALEDPDRLCASLAADALAKTGAPAVPALLEVFQNGPQAARVEAVRALAITADMRAIPVLMQALQEDSALMEYWANEGLERMGLGMMFLEP